LQEPLSDKTDKRLLAPRRRNTGMLYDIVYEGGGSVPEALSGAYTTTKAAIAAIAEYFSTLEHKEANKRPIHRSREHVYKNKAGD